MLTDLRFGEVVVFRTQRRVTVGGREAVLGSRAFDLLLHLIDHRERFVGKDELIETVWSAAAVEDGNLHVHVHALRQRLGKHVITTARGRGYRFTASLDGRQAAERTAQPDDEAGAAPVPMRLHGRDTALAELMALAPAHRMLTLTGPGGIGKTRLAQALSSQLGGGRRDSVWWIDLTLVLDAEQFLSAVAQALLLPASRHWTAAALAQRVRGLAGWIVLDNCEHLLPAVSPLVAAILALPDSPHLIATSRCAVGEPLEYAYEVPPLALPALGTGVDTLAHCAAVALFIDRARQADPHFELAVGDMVNVHHVCRSMDGLPLAIELAAARAPSLGVKGLRAAMDDGLRHLATVRAGALERHRTMTAVLDWSYRLLSAQEQALLRRLSLFAGSFSFEQAVAAAAVAAAERWEFANQFEMLVQHRLLMRQPGMPARWRLLETTRHFAREHLDRTRESEPLRRAHVMTMVSTMRALDAAYFEGEAPERALGVEASIALPDVLAALSACGRDAGLALLGIELYAYSARFLFWGGHIALAQSWADRSAKAVVLAPALEVAVRLAWCHIPPDSIAGPEAWNMSLQRAVQLLDAGGDRARAMHANAWLALRLGAAGQSAAAGHALAAARHAERPEDPARLRSWRLHVESMLAQMHAQGRTDLRALDEMLDDLMATGDGEGRSAHMLAVDRAQALLLGGHFAQAQEQLRQLHDKAVAQGMDCVRMTWLLNYLALAALGLARPEQAREPLEQALVAARRADLMHVVADVLAWYLASEGRYRAACELMGAVEGRLGRKGAAMDAVLSLTRRAVIALTDDACPEEDRRRWTAAGASWSDAGLRKALSGLDTRFVP